MGAEPQRFEHRHRGSHAEGARNVTRRRDHAAFTAADDQRFCRERGIVALFNGRIERVTIDVGDGERVELVVAQ